MLTFVMNILHDPWEGLDLDDSASVSELEAERTASSHASPLTPESAAGDTGADELTRRAEAPLDLAAIPPHLLRGGPAGHVPRRRDEDVRVGREDVAVPDAGSTVCRRLHRPRAAEDQSAQDEDDQRFRVDE